MTFICISRVMDGRVGLTSFFLLECLLESIKDFILDLDKEELIKDLFFDGVYMFLNLQRYIYL